VDRTGRIREIAEKIAISEGMELVDLDFRREGSGTVVRLFIDKPGGVNLTDCQEISGQVAAQLEVEDPVPGSYTLEVSSPGLDRRLTRESHFVQFTGRKARVTTHQPFQGRRKFLGQIEGFAEGKIVLSTEDGGTVEIPLEDVARARLEVEL
jgi:ribosome maturation factor RimP